jgi:hypothetical protein
VADAAITTSGFAAGEVDRSVDAGVSFWFDTGLWELVANSMEAAVRSAFGRKELDDGQRSYFFLRLRRFEAAWALRCRFSAFRFLSESCF